MASQRPSDLSRSTDSGPTDKELLARHADGDPNAFSEIVRRHRDRLWSVALKTLGDPEEAADALQDAFVSAYRAAHTFRGEAAVTTWLHRITVNACLDRARRAKSRRTAPIPEPEQLETLLEPHESAAAPAERQALRQELRMALSELPVEQRAALVLVDMQGYPVAEAARILQAPVGTIKSRCSRGRARLLSLLRHLHPRHAVPDLADESDSERTRGREDASRNRPPGASVPPQRGSADAGTKGEGGTRR